MKKILLIILPFYFFSEGIAQDFAPVGAEWYYSEDEVFAPQGYESFLHVIALKDTLIQDKLCSQLNCDWLCWNPGGIQYVYSNSDSVYLFDATLNEFKLIYAFHAVAGDSIIIPVKDWDGVIDTVVLSIDSTSTITINNIDLIQQFVTYFVYDSFPGEMNTYYYQSEIIETIGDKYFLFNIPIEASLICDANFSRGLRCYDDNYIGHYETGISPTCTYTSVSVNEPLVDSIELYPNPTSDYLRIRHLPVNSENIELLDNLGRIVRSYYPNSEINLEGLPNGIYFLKITLKNNDYYIQKVIKYGI